jgi:hypothetical protein
LIRIREFHVDYLDHAQLFRGAEFWKNSQVHRGQTPVRLQTPDGNDLPVLGTWGWEVARVIAETRFVKKAGPAATR